MGTATRCGCTGRDEGCPQFPCPGSERWGLVGVLGGYFGFLALFFVFFFLLSREPEAVLMLPTYSGCWKESTQTRWKRARVCTHVGTPRF